MGRLTARLADCQEDVEYRVIAGEVQSRVYRVKIVHPLLLKKLQATITPPSYTRQPRVVANDGNWNAIEGSRVELEIELDRSPLMAGLTIKAGGEALPEKIELADRRSQADRRAGSVTRDVELEFTATACRRHDARAGKTADQGGRRSRAVLTIHPAAKSRWR